MADTKGGSVEELADSSLLKSDSLKESMGATPIGATNPWNGYIVNGPYKHEDGRKFIILTKGKHIRKTTSYARYLMEVALGRLLEDIETVDHIDNDKTNDQLGNLRIITRAENIRKSFTSLGMIELKCQYCGKFFQKKNNSSNRCNLKRYKRGPFCSLSCANRRP